MTRLLGLFAALAVTLTVLAPGFAHAATPGHCTTFSTTACGVGANQNAGEFHGLLAVRGVPWVLDLAARSGTQQACGDCSWTLMLACASASPGDPTSINACTGASTTGNCRKGQLLYKIYLSTDAVADRVVGTVCLGGPQQPVPVGTKAFGDVRRYLKDVTPPDLDISTSPSGATLAGLATFFTASVPGSLTPVPFGSGEVTETITLDATVADWHWGDGSTSGWLSASTPLAHSYLHGGIARLTLRTRWGATYTISYQGETFGPYDATGRLVRVQRLALPVDTSAPTLVSR